MSAVGVVSIAVGAIVVANRGLLLLAPAATLAWFKGIVETNGRIRALGAFVLALGATMAWAGASEESVLATILTVLGWLFVGVGTLALVLFPDVYRAVANAVLPRDPSRNLFLWRFRGLVGVVAGAVLIYYGALAL
jgi:hypothetical protein